MELKVTIPAGPNKSSEDFNETGPLFNQAVYPTLIEQLEELFEDGEVGLTSDLNSLSHSIA